MPRTSHRIARFCLALLLSLLPLAAHAGDEQKTEPAALVTTAPVVHKTLEDTILAYGTVQPDPARTHTVAAPREAIVGAVFVRPGQAVKTGDALLTIRNSLNSASQYEQAQAAARYAQNDLDHTNELFKNQMATRDQVAQAEKALHDAQSQLDQLTKGGAAQGDEIIKAQFDGIVIEITAKPGDLLQSGASALAIGDRNDFVVMLGLEPEDAPQIKPDADVLLTSALNPAIKIEAKIASVYGMVDATTHMVDALVPLSPDAADNLIAGMVLTARVQRASVEADAVPRAALMEDEDGPYVYTVSGDTVHKTPVTVLMETDDETALSKGPAVDTDVVISGNAGLEDGMHVRTAQNAAAPDGESAK